MDFPQRDFDDFCERQMHMAATLSCILEEDDADSALSTNLVTVTKQNTNVIIMDKEKNQSDPPTLNTDSVKMLMDTVTALLKQNADILNLMQVNQNQQSLSENGNQNQASGTNNFNIMPDLSMSIENFNEEQSPQHATVWLEIIKSTALLHNWPEVFTLQTAYTHLVGGAKHWLYGRSTDIRTWTDFEKAFRKTFIFEESKTDLWIRMQRRTQHVNENISVYFHDSITLCKACKLEFTEVKEQVAIGLLSEKLHFS